MTPSNGYRISQRISWRDRKGGRFAVESDWFAPEPGRADPAARAFCQALERAIAAGWTEPRWWHWWRWGDWRAVRLLRVLGRAYGG